MKRQHQGLAYVPLLVLTVIFSLTCLLVPAFHHTQIYLTILKNGAYHGILAIGLLFVLLCGEVDLSVGVQMTFYGVLCSVLLRDGWPILPAVAVTLIVSALAGSLLGAAIAHWQLNSMLTTIAVTLVLTGSAFILAGGLPIYHLPLHFGQLASRKLLGLNQPFWIWVALALLAAAILRYTYWGKYFYALGCNTSAAAKAGVPILRTKTVAFGLCGLCCGVCGILNVSQLGFASLESGQSVHFSVLTIAALGGVSFSGGRGRVMPVFLAALLLSALTTLSIVLRVPPYYQTCIKGIILLVAILINLSKS